MNLVIKHQPMIYEVRGVMVMMDRDIAKLYEVETRIINLARQRKKEVFKTISFSLTRREYESLSKKYKFRITNQQNPVVYTEEACYKLSSYLNSPVADQMADVMYKAFKAVKEQNIMIVSKSPQLLELSHEINKISEQMKGFSQPIVNNHFHAPVNYIQGHHNQLNIGTSDDVLMKLIALIMDKQVLEQKELTDLILQSISLANKKEKSGLLDSLSKIVNIGTSIASISSGVPSLIEIVKKLF